MPSASTAAVVVAGMVWCSAAFAADPRISVTVDPAQLPPNYRTSGNLYVTAREAHRAVSTMPDVLLIDVRTHEETLFNGVATPMHRHIPYVVPDIDHTYDAAAERYKLEPNPDFGKAVRNLIEEKGLNANATLLLYCSVGERSARAVGLLSQSGFANVYSVVDGFEGDGQSKAGPGWKASGLPWSHRLRPDQAYKSPSM